MKRLSLQWRMTLLTALLIACACICLNLLLYRSGATGMDSLGGYIMQYQPGDVEGLAIEIPDDQISDFLIHFSQEVCDAKALYGGLDHHLRRDPAQRGHRLLCHRQRPEAAWAVLPSGGKDQSGQHRDPAP